MLRSSSGHSWNVDFSYVAQSGRPRCSHTYMEMNHVWLRLQEDETVRLHTTFSSAIYKDDIPAKGISEFWYCSQTLHCGIHVTSVAHVDQTARNLKLREEE